MANPTKPTPGPAREIKRTEPVTPKQVPPQTATTPRSQPVVEDTTDTVIGRNNSFQGDITGDGDVEIRGNFSGSLTLKNHNLIVGKTGVVNATVSAKNIEIHGLVEGDIHAHELVSVRRESTVAGDIRAARVLLEDGSLFKGSIEMKKNESPSPAKDAKPQSQTPPKDPPKPQEGIKKSEEVILGEGTGKPSPTPKPAPI